MAEAFGVAGESRKRRRSRLEVPTVKRFLPICRRFRSLSSRERAMIVTRSWRLGPGARRRLIGEFLCPAGLGSGSGLAVVTATAPS